MKTSGEVVMLGMPRLFVSQGKLQAGGELCRECSNEDVCPDCEQRQSASAVSQEPNSFEMEGTMGTIGRPGKPMFVAQKFLNAPIVGNPTSFPELETALASVGQPFSPTILQALQASQMAATMRSRAPSVVRPPSMTILVQSEEEKKKELEPFYDLLKDVFNEAFGEVLDKLPDVPGGEAMKGVGDALEAVDKMKKLKNFTKEKAVRLAQKLANIMEHAAEKGPNLDDTDLLPKVVDWLDQLESDGLVDLPDKNHLILAINRALTNRFRNRTRDPKKWEEFREGVGDLKKRLDKLQE